MGVRTQILEKWDNSIAEVKENIFAEIFIPSAEDSVFAVQLVSPEDGKMIRNRKNSFKNIEPIDIEGNYDTTFFMYLIQNDVKNEEVIQGKKSQYYFVNCFYAYIFVNISQELKDIIRHPEHYKKESYTFNAMEIQITPEQYLEILTVARRFIDKYCPEEFEDSLNEDAVYTQTSTLKPIKIKYEEIIKEEEKVTE